MIIIVLHDVVTKVVLSKFAVGLQVAMLLHKLRPQKNPYYFWAVMSIVMQACILFQIVAYEIIRVPKIRALKHCFHYTSLFYLI